MKKTICVILLCLLAFPAVGCTPQAKKVKLSERFDNVQAATMLTDGTNTLTGNAFMRQAGGNVVTCAGSPVHLIPATSYATERISHLYGNTTSGVAMNPIAFEPNEPEYTRLMKKETCDSQGNFTFEKVADGTYYITTTVQWLAGPYNPQGGALMKKVSLNGGVAQKIVMSH